MSSSSAVHTWARLLLCRGLAALASPRSAQSAGGAAAQALRDIQAQIKAQADGHNNNDSSAHVARSLSQIHGWMTGAAQKLAGRAKAASADQANKEIRALRGLIFTNNGAQVHSFGDVSGGRQASASLGSVTVYSTQPSSPGIQLLLSVVAAVFECVLVGEELQHALEAVGVSLLFGGVSEVDAFVEALIAVLQAQIPADDIAGVSGGDESDDEHERPAQDRKKKDRRSEKQQQQSIAVAAPASVVSAVAAPPSVSADLLGSSDMFANLSLAPQPSSARSVDSFGLMPPPPPQQQQQQQPQAPSASLSSMDFFGSAGPPSAPAASVRAGFLPGPAVSSSSVSADPFSSMSPSASSSAFAAPAPSAVARPVGGPKPSRPASAAGGAVRPSAAPASASISASSSVLRAPAAPAAAARHKEEERSAESVQRKSKKKAEVSRKQSVEFVAPIVSAAPAAEEAEEEAMPAMRMEAEAPVAASVAVDEAAFQGADEDDAARPEFESFAADDEDVSAPAPPPAAAAPAVRDSTHDLGRDRDSLVQPLESVDLESVDRVLRDNISELLERGDRLENLEARSERLDDSAKSFQRSSASLKKKGLFGGLFSKDKSRPKPKPKPKQKKKKKTKIDNIFADIENVFNGLSALMHRYTDFPKRNICFSLLCAVPAMIIVWIGVASFTLAILLPAVFLLLVLRTQTIERKVETGFVVRQAVLAQETVQEKSLRFISLLLRALPMAALLVAWPIVAVFVLIPRNRDKWWIDLVTIGSFLVVMLILQILGTIRSARSFLEKMRANHEGSVDAWNKAHPDQARLPAAAPQPPPSSGHDSEEEDEAAKKKAVPITAMPHAFYSATFERNMARNLRWANLRNIVAVLSLTVEAVQLVLFSVQTLDAGQVIRKQDPDPAATASDSSPDSATKHGGGGTFGPAFVPWLFLNAVGFLSENILYFYAFTALFVVALLLLLFLAQFFKELLTFARAKAEGTADGTKRANEVFFHSFIGSIVYGHGEVRHVSSLVSNMVALLADTLFLIVAGKLMAVFTCTVPSANEPARLLIDQRVICWEGDHQLLACLALIAFAYYLPLASMISPMLVESDNAAAEEAASVAAGGQTVAQKVGKKDVSFATPFLSMIIVSKCLLQVSAFFFGKQDPIVTVVSSMVVSLMLIAVTGVWISRSHSTIFRSKAWYATGSFQSFQFIHVSPPCTPDSIGIFRIISFGGGVVGSIVAIVAYSMPDTLGGDRKYEALAIIALVFIVVGMVWRLQTKRIPLAAIFATSSSPAVHPAAAGSSTVGHSVVTIHTSADDDALPSPLGPKDKRTGSLRTQLNPNLLRSSSEEGAIEMAELSDEAHSEGTDHRFDQKNNNAQREEQKQGGQYSPPPNRLSYAPTASAAAAAPSSPSASATAASSADATSSSSAAQIVAPSSFALPISSQQAMQFVDGVWTAGGVVLNSLAR